MLHDGVFHIDGGVKAQGQREVELYRRLAATVPVRTPRSTPSTGYPPSTVYASPKSTSTATTQLTGTVARWHIAAIVQSVAKMNAAFVGKTAERIRARAGYRHRGLYFLGFVGDLAGKEPKWFRGLWQALCSHYEHQPTTLVHGDCRPGNMLFVGDTSTVKLPPRTETEESPWPGQEAELPCVVFADWEAVNVAPVLWDFVYCTTLGLTIAGPTGPPGAVAGRCLSALHTEGVSPDTYGGTEQAELDAALLTIVLGYYSYTVVSRRLWDHKGNTDTDLTAWRERLTDACANVDAEAVGTCLDVAPNVLAEFVAHLEKGLRRQ